MNTIKQNRASLNLELSLIIALLVITSVVGLGFLGARISNSFINVASFLSPPKPKVVPIPEVTGSTDNKKITLDFTSSEKITAYEVQTDSSPTFPNPTSINVLALEGTTQYEISTVPNIDVYIRVRGVNNEIISKWSNALAYSVDLLNATPIFTDNFDRTDNTTIGNGWSQAQDPGAIIYGIKNNQFTLQNSLTGTQCLYVYRSRPTFNDTVITEKYYYSAPGGSVGLSMSTVNGYWYNSTFNGYTVLFSSAAVQIFKVSNYTTTALVSKNVSINSGDTVAFKRLGNELITYINGVEVASITDSTYKNFVSVGTHIFGNKDLTTQLDDFTIYNATDYPNTKITPITVP